ncbi:hypothetical protein [Pectobacterium brasiliense]|uniref:hypothetical protein n=1 Tax=Pectobacterium brasiliense TaxID=180957 RepID=UPI001968AAD6|nr:hypothetical protein [Pectobacterium brasiliense]MBN3265781.1 hypothetical protein [Pectobacterium brasiliense]
MDIFADVFMGILFVFNHIFNTAAETSSIYPFGGVVYLLVMLLMVTMICVTVYLIARDVIRDVKKLLARSAVKAQG